nr:ribbon-helix-helix domain-containing protein [Candidatus Sigynarchaeota archaeon]
MATKISVEIPHSMLSQLDSICKTNDYQSRSEAIRSALKDFITKEIQRMTIAKFLEQLARGEMPDYLRDNRIDARKKKDLESVEQLL